MVDDCVIQSYTSFHTANQELKAMTRNTYHHALILTRAYESYYILGPHQIIDLDPVGLFFMDCKKVN